MAYDLILKNIAKHITLNKKEKNYFISVLKEQEIKKKEFVLREGQLCKNISYVISGTLRAYYLDKEGKESTIMFAIADWWITDMPCFINEQPAMMFIEAVKNSQAVPQKQRESIT